MTSNVSLEFGTIFLLSPYCPLLKMPTILDSLPQSANLFFLKAAVRYALRSSLATGERYACNWQEVRDLGRTRSWRRSAQAEWARCTAASTAVCIATLPSKFLLP